MCVIILGEKKHIPLDILKKAEQSNPTSLNFSNSLLNKDNHYF